MGRNVTNYIFDRGFLYAIAHVRGGSEKGWRWYREGKLAQKMNTFTDFIAASEYLRKNGWCAPGKIVAEGRSDSARNRMI